MWPRRAAVDEVVLAVAGRQGAPRAGQRRQAIRHPGASAVGVPREVASHPRVGEELVGAPRARQRRRAVEVPKL